MPHISAAVWHGPVAMSYFDERLMLSYARQIFRWTLLSIGDLTRGMPSVNRVGDRGVMDAGRKTGTPWSLEKSGGVSSRQGK
jgi:hypothetical protein